MTTANELGCSAEIKHLKALLHFKDTHILTLEETIRILKQNNRCLRRKHREKKTDANLPETAYVYEDWVGTKRLGGTILPEKTLVYENKVCDLECLCAHCQRHVKTL